MGMLIFLGVALAALWLVAAYGFYKESERVKYDVRVSPGAVTYGTHSTALMPVSVAPIRHSLPMLSGGEIRSYAHGGHASMPTAVTNQGQLHTTSSAKVKSIGSGTGNGGLFTSSGSSNRSSSRGIQYSGGSVAMPSIAMVSTSSATRAEKATRAIGMRKAKWSTPDPDDGEWGDWFDGGGDGWWYHDKDGWREVQYGDKRIDGQAYYWNGYEWVEESQWDPETAPVGPMPWIFMLLLTVGYIGVKKRKELVA